MPSSNRPNPFNPFSFLIKTKKFPLANLIGSSLWQRVSDTFWFLSGDKTAFFKFEFKTTKQSPVFGFLDFLHPGLLLLMMMPTSNNWFANGCAAILKTIAAVFFHLKSLAALLLTLILSPIVILTHLLIMPFMNKLSHKINSIEILPVIIEKNFRDPGLFNAPSPIASAEMMSIFGIVRSHVQNEELRLKEEAILSEEPELRNATLKLGTAFPKLSELCIRPIFKCTRIGALPTAEELPVFTVADFKATPPNGYKINSVGFGLFSVRNEGHFSGLHFVPAHVDLKAFIEANPQNAQGITGMLQSNVLGATEAFSAMDDSTAQNFTQALAN